MFLEKKTLHKIWLNPGLKLTAPFEQSVFIWYGTGKISGAPKVNFRKISQCSEEDKLGFQPSKQGRQELPGLILQSIIDETYF